MTTERRPTLAAAYERLVDEIGRSAPPVRAEVRRRDIERYVRACSADTATGLDGEPAPALFLPSVQELGTGAGTGRLRTDGTGTDRTSFLALEGFRLMGGGQDLTFHRPFQTTLEDVVLKNGRSGELILLTLQSQYFDGEGHLVTTCRDTIVVR
jgi:hypothetical protein